MSMKRNYFFPSQSNIRFNVAIKGPAEMENMQPLRVQVKICLLVAIAIVIDVDGM